MRQVLWAYASYLWTLLVALSLWGAFRFSAATRRRYGGLTTAGLLALLTGATAWLIASSPLAGPFAAALTVTLFADNHSRATVAGLMGPDLFHERMTETIRRHGAVAFLKASVPTQALHLALALLLVALSRGPEEWFYWAALGYATARVMAIVGELALARKYQRPPEAA